MGGAGPAWAQASWLLGGPGALSPAGLVLAEALCSSVASNSPGILCPEVLSWHPPGLGSPSVPRGLSLYGSVSVHRSKVYGVQLLLCELDNLSDSLPPLCGGVWTLLKPSWVCVPLDTMCCSRGSGPMRERCSPRG